MKPNLTLGISQGLPPSPERMTPSPAGKRKQLNRWVTPAMMVVVATQICMMCASRVDAHVSLSGSQGSSGFPPEIVIES